jgi:predicted Rossmann-fold nucleotide-binding protein
MLAQKGFVIVNGGGPGVMDASTKGAVEVGGETISVTFSPHEATGYEGKYLGNVTDEEIVTTNYIERMFKLLEHADMFIIFKGGTGTISEFGTAWVLAKLYYGHHKPFILYGDFWIDIIDVFRRNMNLDREELGVFEIVSRESEILPIIKKFEKRLESVDHSKVKFVPTGSRNDASLCNIHRGAQSQRMRTLKDVYSRESNPCPTIIPEPKNHNEIRQM